MAEPALPQKLETTQRLQKEGAKRDTAPILLPTQTPAIPTRRSPPPLSPRPAFSPVLHPLPKPTVVPPAPSEAHLLPRAPAPEDFGDVPVQPRPKKETARITILPAPSPAIVQLAPGTVATSKAIEAFDSIPRWSCWGLLGLSALIFLIQIWNYALS